MKAWQKILALGITSLLILVFYVGYTLYTILTAVGNPGKEGFQSVSTDVFNPGPESNLERQVFDDFVVNNTLQLQQPPPTSVPAFDPATALAEFDENAPIPWDQDNKADDPINILWGYVDARCSRELWDRARLQNLFNTANTIEISPETGQLMYYSSKLDGRIFHEPAAINAVKFAEFLMDFAYEEIIEGTIEKLNHKVFGESIETLAETETRARKAVADAAKAAKAAGTPLSKSAMTTLYDQKFKEFYEPVVDSIKRRNALAAAGTAGTIGRGIPKSQLLSYYAKKGVGAALSAVYGLPGRLGKLAQFRSSSKVVPTGLVQKAVSASELRRLGMRGAAAALSRVSGKLAASLVRKAAQSFAAMQAAATFTLAIPIVGEVTFPLLSALGILLNVAFLMVIPQVMTILADLDEDPYSSNCDQNAAKPFQGCPPTHPFNLRCAIINGTSSAFYEFIVSIPYVGDAISAFAPYLCSTPGLGETVFRQSFRPPPYYFDTTLSLFYTDKPKLLDGGYNGINAAAPAYRNPAQFTLTGKQYSDTTRPDDLYHPWVDYSHTDMLDAMAAFYYDSAVRNQSISIDGKATFQYITNFRGIIASSQYSCDVQVELNERTYDPVSGQILSDTHVPNPFEDGTTADTGCTFHDRRFYFTVDFVRAAQGGSPGARAAAAVTVSPLDSVAYTNAVKLALQGQSDSERLAAYRRMFKVVGCTNMNGTAPCVVDYTADGSFVGDAPVAIGAPGQPYAAPMRYIRDPNILNQLPNDQSCSAIRSNLSKYMNNRLSGNSSLPPTNQAPTDMDVIYTGGKDAAGNDFYTPGLTTDYVPTETTGIPQGLTQDALNASYRAAIYKGKKYNTTPISYIFWNMTTKAAPTTTDSLSDYTWVKYSPKSVWRNDNEPWLIGSTKLWSVTPISASERQKWLDGLTGAFIGGLPLRFGFEGGLAATLLDITGLQTALACTYQDVLKQTGTYLLNGMLLTSQDRFFINRGPAIQYAPGYVPAIEGRKCTSIPITNKICADRLNIRRMAKLYTYKRQTRRVKRVTGIVPDTVNNNCVYFIQDIGINPADNNRDIPGTEASYSYALPFTITNKNTCAYTPTGLEILDALGETNIGPIPYKSSDFAPALTSATFNALSSTPNPAFPRSSCAAASRSAYSDCSKQAIQDKLIADFNSQYMIVEGDPSQGYTAKITSIRASKTPLPKEVNAQGPVCVYDANVVVKKNGADQPATSAIITMSLAADPSDTCGYTLDTHDYPKNYFLSQVPRTGFIELPPFQSATRSILRDTCTDAVIQSLKGTTDATQVTAFKASYSDCSGQEMIDRLVRVYNSRPGRTQKILRVVAASTPALSDGKLACDYEVDILRKSTDAIVADQKYYLDHDTVRLYLTPATDNACLYDIDWSADLTASMRGSGASIDPSSGLQNLVTQYIWSSSYATGIRKALNAATGMFRSLDVPNTVKSATQDTKTRVGTLARGLSSGVTLEGCAPLTCSSPEVLNSFVRRYNYDNFNVLKSYPDGQFGATRRNIVALRRAGLYAGTECQVELIEREETFQNIMKKPNPDPSSGANVDINRRTYLRQYRFFVDVKTPATATSACSFAIRPFTATDIQQRTFDISGGAIALDTTISSWTAADTAAQKISFVTPILNPWYIPMLNTIRLAINGYKSPATNFVSQTFKSFLWATNPRPNVIEYYAKVTERFSDPDFGVANYDNEEVICVAQWDESMWNPSTGSFTFGDGSVVPNPTSFAVYNVRRATIVGQKVSFDGVIVDPPPYLYLPLNVNAPLEVSVIQYPPVPSGQGTGVGASLGLDTSVGSKGWAVTLRSGAKQSYTQNGSLTCAEGRCA